MIGISKLYCGTVEPSDALRYGRQSKELPSHLLQFSIDKKPVVVWNMTRRCNLKCVHCYAKSEDIDYDNELTHEQSLAMIDDLAQFGVPVLLFSGGEPLVHPRLVEYAQYAVSKGMRAVISTNGTLITEEKAKQLKEIGLSYAAAIGGGRAGVIETTFKEETETDLFGEQVILCGGVSSLIKASFETLVEAGYQPELAYFETMHELKLIVDLMYRGGLNYMRFSVSETAEYGDYVSGPRVTEGAKQAMQDVLADIQSGRFAERWIDEYDSGGAEFNRMRDADHDHQIEQVGARLRSQMAWLDPVEVSAGQAQATTTGAAAPRAKGDA